MTVLPGGYAGKYLRLNLSSGEYKIFEHDPGILRKYIGGTGIAIKHIFEEVNKGVDPYSENNILLFATGPFTGTSIPGSGNFTVASRSPLSGFFVSAQANGHFGPALKKTGFDYIIIEGKSEKPVYLFIEDEFVTILDASWLKGMGTTQTERKLKEKHGDKVRVACIGPAGENLVRFACVLCDEGHVAASGGIGAVMGSKNLKAIAVRGTKNIPIYNKHEFMQNVRDWTKDTINSGLGKTLNSFGTPGLFTSYHRAGWVPVKNLTTNEFPEHESFDGRQLRQKYEMKRHRCHACPLDHCKTLRITEGKNRGFEGEEPEYEDLAAWGPNIGNANVEEAIVLTGLVDEFGFDTKESTFIISLLMECFEKGLINEETLDGIEAKWGNIEGVKSLLQKIAMRDGVGRHLAEGIMYTAGWIGGEALSYAVYVKRGYAPHVHDLRTRWGTLFTQAISNMCSQEGIDLTERNSMDLEISEPVGFSLTGIPNAQSKSGKKRQFEDSLGVCYFLCRGNGGIDIFTHALNSLTGWDLTKEESLEIGERIINLQRCFNIRHGHTAEDDSVSPRILEPPKDGPKKGESMSKTFEILKKNYYQVMGWDETGCPRPETLERLGIDFVGVTDPAEEMK